MDYAALPPTLYLIPTPIGAEGPAGALTEQGQAVVRRLRFFAVENVRTARRFLSALEMPVPIDALEIVPFDRESTDENARELISRLAPGSSLGVLSEAGAPGVADPGARLAAMAHSMNVAVCPLVGASSLLLTLMASGLNGQSFAFNGYLPINVRFAAPSSVWNTRPSLPARRSCLSKRPTAMTGFWPSSWQRCETRRGSPSPVASTPRSSSFARAPSRNGKQPLPPSGRYPRCLP